MDWIKKNPAKVALAVIALAVVAASYLLWQNISNFHQNFGSERDTRVLTKGIPEIDTKPLADAAKGIAAPSSWSINLKDQGSLFVGKAFVRKGNSPTIESPEGGMLNPPVSNAWLEKYGQDYLNQEVLSEDPDKDGFNNLLEYLGMDGKDGTDDSTDPTKAESHPPHHTRLTLAKTGNSNGIVSIPFRLRFMTYDINPRNPKDITVQINTIDKGNRTSFVPVGEDIPGTTFKIESFEKKETPQENGTTKDESTLTIVNKVTGQKVPLPINVVINSPESYLVLRYLWVEPGKQPTPDMNLKKDQTFKLPPDLDKTYKVLDIKAPGENPQTNPGEVTIQLPTGTKLILKTNDPDLPR
jgi:hypothetical protein